MKKTSLPIHILQAFVITALCIQVHAMHSAAPRRSLYQHGAADVQVPIEEMAHVLLAHT